MNKNLDTLDLTGSQVMFDYTNWKGVRSTRRVRVIRFFYGTSDYHKGHQFFMHGMDIDKQEKRDFAVKDIHSLRQLEGWTS